VAVKLTIAGREPFRSFARGAADAAAMFATLTGDELDALPGAALFGIARLRGAIAGLADGEPGESALPREEPDAYRGVIAIEWPPPNGASPYSSMPGCLVSVTDALTGKPIMTCTKIIVHADAGALVTADLTMFADADGEPLLDGEPVIDGDGFRTGVFPFLVSEMRVRHA